MLKKSVTLCLTAALIGTAAHAKVFKKYEVRSAKVNYSIRGSGNVMGAMLKEEGEKRLLFDQYGFRQLEEEKTTRTTMIMGQPRVEREHKARYRNGTKVKEVDYIRQTSREFEPPSTALMIAAANQNLVQMGEEFLRQMGGKKIGADTVAGYRCDVWKFPVVTQCIYRGVPLRTESSAVGIRRIETATKAEFDVPVSPQSYKLPDFPGQQIPKSDEMGAPAPEEIQKALRQMQQGQSRKFGVSTDPLAIMKQEYLAQEPDYRFAKTCFQLSKKLSEANDCEKMFSHRIGEPSQPISRWDEATKRSILKDIDRTLKSMECVKKARTLQAMERCEPRE